MKKIIEFEPEKSKVNTIKECSENQKKRSYKKTK